MKNCRECGTELIIGTNWTENSKNHSVYWCKTCRSNYQKPYDLARNKKKKEYLKIFNKKNKKKLAKQNAILNKSIPAGVYCVKEKGIIVYIGSSVSPYKRRSCHFSVNKFGGQINNSTVANAIANGIVKREDLTFELMEPIDNYRSRKDREIELINHHQPKLNTYSK